VRRNLGARGLLCKQPGAPEADAASLATVEHEADALAEHLARLQVDDLSDPPAIQRSRSSRVERSVCESASWSRRAQKLSQNAGSTSGQLSPMHGAPERSSTTTASSLAVRYVRALLERHGLPKYKQSPWVADAPACRIRKRIGG
jgi:hypothetical protein